MSAREWWIASIRDEDDWESMVTTYGPYGEYYHNIHVIEYSAYEQLQKELDEQCKINQAGQERELRLIKELERLNFDLAFEKQVFNNNVLKNIIKSQEDEILRLQSILSEAFLNLEKDWKSGWIDAVREVLMEKCPDTTPSGPADKND